MLIISYDLFFFIIKWLPKNPATFLKARSSKTTTKQQTGLGCAAPFTNRGDQNTPPTGHSENYFELKIHENQHMQGQTFSGCCQKWVLHTQNSVVVNPLHRSFTKQRRPTRSPGEEPRVDTTPRQTASQTTHPDRHWHKPSHLLSVFLSAHSPSLTIICSPMSSLPCLLRY